MNIGMISVSFSSFKYPDLIMEVLNIVFNVSKQMFLRDLKCFRKMLLDVIEFLGQIRCSCFSLSDKGY